MASTFSAVMHYCIFMAVSESRSKLTSLVYPCFRTVGCHLVSASDLIRKNPSMK
nr:MAG TPA: hypothetical protein [Caudoviricetes sp.]